MTNILLVNWLIWGLQRVDHPHPIVVLYKCVNTQRNAERIILERIATTLAYAGYAINIRIIVF